MWPWKTLLFVLTILNFATSTWSECLHDVISRDWYTYYLKYSCTNMTRERYQNFMNDKVLSNADYIVRELKLIQINLPTIDQHLFPNDEFGNVYNLTIKNCGVTTVEDHSFDTFTNLKYLYILDNNIIYANGQFVKYLAKLNLLDLSNNNMQQFNIHCNHQKQFTNLIFNNNSLISLRENSFNNCEFLKAVEIRNCNMKEIQKNSFAGLNSLSRLDLTNNPIARVESGAFSGLTRISNFNFRDIFKGIRDIKSGMFNGFENVQGLNFSYLNIQSLEGRSFQGLKSLEYLYLDNNNISILRSWTFADLPRLKYLSFHHNPIIEIEPHAFVNIPDYRIIDFHKISRHMKHIPEGFFDGIRNVTVLNLTDLNIYTIEPEAFEDVNFLEHLFLNHNNLEALGAYQFSKFHRLQSLALANNPIEFINPTAFFNLTNLQHLNMSSTNLTFLENGTFDSLTSLNILDLSFCKLKKLEVEIFCKSELYLNNNEIEYISLRAFQNLTSLNRLYFQFNKVSHLEIGVFSAMEQLRYLDMSHNELCALGEPLLQPLKSLRQIELSGNRWSCQHLTAIRKYFQSHGIAYHSKTHNNFSVNNIGGIECITEVPESNKNIQTILNSNKNDSNKNIMTETSNRKELNKTIAILLNNRNDSIKMKTDFISNNSMNSPEIILDTMANMNEKLHEIYIIIYLVFIFITGYLCLKIVCFIYKSYKKYCSRKRPLGQNSLTEMVLLNRRCN